MMRIARAVRAADGGKCNYMVAYCRLGQGRRHVTLLHLPTVVGLDVPQSLRQSADYFANPSVSSPLTCFVTATIRHTLSLNVERGRTNNHAIDGNPQGLGGHIYRCKVTAVSH